MVISHAVVKILASQQWCILSPEGKQSQRLSMWDNDFQEKKIKINNDYK